MTTRVDRTALGGFLALFLLSACQDDVSVPAPAASATTMASASTTASAKPAFSAGSQASASAAWAKASKARADAVKPSVKGEEIMYEADGVKLKGYLAYDTDIEGKRPGVLVVHEWWGHNEYSRKRARMLANLGYTALAVDMYGDGKQADHPDDAKKFMTEVFSNMPGSEKRFAAAEKLLDEHATTDASKTAAIGYCFGGAVVLHMARSGSDLAAVASFHGNLSTKSPAKKGDIKGDILVLHGEADPLVPAEQVDAFKKEMKEAEASMRLIAYPGAKHAFTNPDATELGKKFDMPIAYDADADEKSWNQLRIFLNSTFALKN